MRPLVLLSFLLVSCGGFTGKKSQDAVPSPLNPGFNAGGMMGFGFKKPPEGDKIAIGDAPVESAGYIPTAVKGGEVKIQGFVLPSDDSIAWSDEENPDAAIAFDKEFKGVKKIKTAWWSSYRKAKRESSRTGKPLLIWFTRTGESASPICKTLKREVFERPDFKRWAKGNVIRLKLDLSGGSGGSRGGNGEIMDEETRKRSYLAKLKKRYRVLGLPAVVMNSPASGVLEQYRGYKKGSSSEYFGQLKNTELTHAHNYGVWKRKMTAKGYRVWTGKNDQIVFAKILRYRQGKIILVEPDGKKIKTDESQLSAADRRWIDAEKARRKRG